MDKITITVSGPPMSGKSTIIAIIFNALGAFKPSMGPHEKEDGDTPDFIEALTRLQGGLEAEVVIDSQTLKENNAR